MFGTPGPSPGALAAGCVLAASGCVVAVDESVTIDEPVERIVIEITAGDVTVRAHHGPVTLTSDFGGAGRDPVGHEVRDGTLTVLYDCQLCAGEIEIEAPARTAVTAALGAGDLEISGMAGWVTAALSVGDASIEGHGPGPVSLDNDLGSIDATFAERPERVEIEVGTGDVALVLPEGAYALELEARTGSVAVSGVEDDPRSPNAVEVAVRLGDIALRGR